MVIFFRHEKYNAVDAFFEENKDKMLFSIKITGNKDDLNLLFDSNNQILMTFSDCAGVADCFNDVNSFIAERMRPRWIHYDKFDDIDNLNKRINFCYMTIVTSDVTNCRPVFSLFTTCYNSYSKILRAYESIKCQTLRDWEWVILDDSPNDEHFVYLKSVFKNESRVRLYKRSENSGSIGNVKNEAVLLCRGKYVIEMDHDDEILPYTLGDAAKVFDKDPEVGFVYMDYSNLYENGNTHSYGNSFSLGYAGYYCQKYKNTWINVASHGNVNNITLSHIVAVPNHPRMWRKDALIKMGNYSEFLPVSDDYELLLRTAVNTKIARIHKLGYIQYMNDNNNNFSLIRNSEINRLCVEHLFPHCYKQYNINGKMMELGAHEDENYMAGKSKCSQTWKRENYEYKFCNAVYNLDFDKQFCVIGLETLKQNIDEIRDLYNGKKNEFFVLDNKIGVEELIRELELLNFVRMKCYAMSDCSDEELVKYFHLVCRSCKDHFVYGRGN